MIPFAAVRARHVRRMFLKLTVRSGTVPDGFSGGILTSSVGSLVVLADFGAGNTAGRCLAAVLVQPLDLLTHKKGSRVDPTNCRGIYLTRQVSKVMERELGFFIQQFFEVVRVYGPRQYACSTGIGHRDALR